MLPTRDKALELLNEYVKDDYQRLHALMVANALEEYAIKLNEDKDLWFITGLLHDLDYFLYPEEHPNKSIEWFNEWNYPQELIQAVAAHYWEKTGVEPNFKLGACLVACDELCGFLYAYSLMRPEKFNGMQASSVKKKFKDSTFAQKINRDDIVYGIEKLGVEFDSHVMLLISVFEKMPELK
mgnify:CR=1 FL=1